MNRFGHVQHDDEADWVKHCVTTVLRSVELYRVMPEADMVE